MSAPRFLVIRLLGDLVSGRPERLREDRTQFGGFVVRLRNTRRRQQPGGDCRIEPIRRPIGLLDDDTELRDEFARDPSLHVTR